MTTDELRQLPHLTAGEVGECLRVKTESGWRLTDGERYCTRLFCALTAELPEYKITNGTETYLETETPSDSPKGETAEAETDNTDKAAGASSPAADAAADTQTDTREDDRITTAETTENDRITTAGETETTAETTQGWAAKAWTGTCEWCAKAWADVCEWCAKVWRKITNKA